MNTSIPRCTPTYSANVANSLMGGAYHRGRVVFGPAVIDAYELESQVAKYPRILVTESVREEAWGYHTGLCRGRLFLQDFDGCWFLNVLAPPLSKWKAISDVAPDRNARAFLRIVRGRLADELGRVNGDLRRLSKLRWIAHHFNIAAAKEGGVEMIDVPLEVRE